MGYVIGRYRHTADGSLQPFFYLINEACNGNNIHSTLDKNCIDL